MDSPLTKQTRYDEGKTADSDEPAACGHWSAAITNFNGESLVCETIASLKQLEHPPSEILLIDDGSTDASLERVRAEHPDVRIVSLGRNTGVLNIVRNCGLREARHRFVLIADNDVTFPPDAVRHLMGTLQEREDAAACTPLIVDADDEQTLLGQGHRLHFLCWSTVPRATTVEGARQLGEHKAIGGGIQLIDKERAAPVGFFDEQLVLGWGDDGEFHFRLQLAGLGCYTVPKAIVFHRRVRQRSRFYGQLHNRWWVLLKHINGERFWSLRLPWCSTSCCSPACSSRWVSGATMAVRSATSPTTGRASCGSGDVRRQCDGLPTVIA